MVDTSRLNAITSVYVSYIKQTKQEYGPLHHVQLENAYVTGQGAVITRDLRMLYESCRELIYNGMTPDNLSGESNGQFRFEADVGKRIERPSLLVKRPWWRNYGHWLVDGAALIALSSALSFRDDWQIVIGRHEDTRMRKIVYETLSIVAPGVPVIEHPDSEIWQFDRLHYVMPVHCPPLFKLPHALGALRALVLADLLPIKCHRNIYVSRGGGRPRPLENEAEFTELLEKRGFEVVHPELLTLKEQAALFRSADIVVGVKGAALTNGVFCGASTALVVLSPDDFPDPFYWDIAGQQGLSYVEIFGPVSSYQTITPDNPFSISVDRFTRAIDRACSRRDRPKNTGWSVASNGTSFKMIDSTRHNIPPRDELAGEFYQFFLARIHATLRPRSYFEIGSPNGDTLKLAQCNAIAVDPKFQFIAHTPIKAKLALCLFQMTSDEFFAAWDPGEVLKGPIDLAFLDGMHQVECLLRDFIHTEKACHKGSTILLHDCVPLDLQMAGREETDLGRRALSVHPEWWAGDVWKMLPILRKYRPELNVTIFNAPPTGMVLIRGLDPNSSTLTDHYFEIIGRFCEAADEFVLFEDQISKLEMTDTSKLAEVLDGALVG